MSYSFFKSIPAAVIFILAVSLLPGCKSAPVRPSDKPAASQTTDPLSSIAIPGEALQCSGAEECFTRALEAEKAGKKEAAGTYLEITFSRYPDSPWFQRAGFLYGKWKIESKSPVEETLLLKVQSAYPEMGDYLSKLLADQEFNQENFSKAGEDYARLLVMTPDTVLRPQVLIQIGETWFRLKDYEKAAQTFSVFYHENPRDEKAPEILNKMLEIYLLAGDRERGAKIFREVEWKFPDSQWSQEAEKQVSQALLLPDDRQKFKLTLQEKFNKGKTLYEIGRFEKALEIWKELNNPAGRQEPFFNEMELKTGLAFLYLKKNSDAERHFHIVLKNAPDSEFAPEALLGLVRGSFYEDRHQASRAHALYQTIIKELPQSPVAPDALWKDGWLAYKEGDYPAAEKNFSGLLEQYPASVLQTQALYWLGRTKERQNDPEAAQNDFKRLCQNFDHSYYCHLAIKRMTGAVRSSGLPEVDASAQGDSSYQKDIHYLKARELMSMNLAREASREFNYLADHYRDKGALLLIDQELIRAGDFYHALKNLRSQFPDVLDRGRTYELPLLWKLAYPREILDLIRQVAGETRIEPHFVAGIMREESVFDTRATSRSGAMGLMQLMPFTGEWVADRLGVASFVREQLYNQELNIRFGAYYLDHLNEKFQGNLVLTAASYNAGPEAVNKWIANGNLLVGDDLEEFVENIPFQETRYYVKRVMRSYHEFKEIGELTKNEPYKMPNPFLTSFP
ncbi:MAG: transglycosylase SLT domain-containing protein [Nitrospirae bacterium]|nr:transglycosylase SLT domain-containing protein [Nitrospirota bacterium]